MALPDDLATLKDDMVAFTEGHGMRRFPGYVDHEEVQTVMWKAGDDAESWKDFVELAKTSGSMCPSDLARGTRPLASRI